MSKMEVLKEMMNSENGGLYAAIGGIVLVFGIDRITKSNYKVDAKKESFTMGPATEPVKELEPEKAENAQ